MNKAGKIIVRTLVTLAIILVVAVGGFITMAILHGPSQPTVLTDEDVAAQNKEQSQRYANTDLSGFKTQNVNGEDVDASIFADYDITMVNIWFTGCSPCIAEMPEIEKLYEQLPQNYNIITICTDTIKKNDKIDKGSIDTVKDVMEDAKAQFMTLIPDEILKEQISEKTRIFPTTIFVDSEGKVVGEPHFGGRSAEQYLQSIEERAKLLDKEM